MLDSPSPAATEITAMEQILRRHAGAPALEDDAVVDYLVAFLLQQQQELDNNCDGGGDGGESLMIIDTVAQFLDGNREAAAAIAAELRTARSDHNKRSTTRPPQQETTASSEQEEQGTTALRPPRLLSAIEEKKEVEETYTINDSERNNTDSNPQAVRSPAADSSRTRTVSETRSCGQQQQQQKSRRKERRKQRAGAGGKHPRRGKHTSPENDDDTTSDKDEPPSRTTTTTTTTTQQPGGDEDEASAWGDCLAAGRVWGGRGRGGRGAYAGRTNSVNANIHLESVAVALPHGGPELLRDATVDLARGRRYGLCGRNGAGKSTLLRRLARCAIPGLPHDLRVLLVEQQQDIPTPAATSRNQSLSALDMLVQSDAYRTSLLREQERLEALLEDPKATTKGTDLVEAAEELGLLAAELEAIHADTAEERATTILRGLQFTPTMVHGPAANLSGGWRMRLALARALFLPNVDLILLDECTNHLDLHGLDWLIGALTGSEEKTLIVVSHDRAFLDAVCTDIVVLEHQRLSYHVGNYSMYERQMCEKAARESQILDAAERQRSRAQAFVQKQQQAAHKKSADPNRQRQAKMIRDKKLDRIGNYREDGKRYKLRSLKQLDEKSVRLAQKVQIEVDEPVVQMYFPNPVWPPAVGPHDAIVRLEDLSFGYPQEELGDEQRRLLLKDVTLTIDRGSKIALVGSNGSGKSTLVKLIAGELELKKNGSMLHRQPNIRIGHLTQYAVEELEQYAKKTVVEYAEEHLMSGRATSSIVAKSAGSGNVRQYLGAFGLGGKHAHRPIGKLSGGERMRLCFAKVLADEPHLLLLDESTNHVDIETLESMAKALNEYEGSVLMVSHNQFFLSAFCTELWVLDDGHVTVNKSEESFDEMFSQYRSSILQKGGTTLSDRRQHMATMAKRATKQRVGAHQSTSLL